MRKSSWMSAVYGARKGAGKALGSALALGVVVAFASHASASDQIVSDDKIDPCLPSAINLSVNSGLVGASTLSDLLAEHRLGGPVLSAKVRKLALSDASKIHDILIAAKTATPEQVTAIGAGLADVIRRCGDMLPELAVEIGDEVTNAKFPSLTVAFVTHLPAEALIQKKKVKGELSMTAPPGVLPADPARIMTEPAEIPKPSTAEIVARTKELPVKPQSPGAGPFLADGITPGPKFNLGPFTIGKPGLTFSGGGGGGQTEISKNTVSPTR
jgi:hypothetical protein